MKILFITSNRLGDAVLSTGLLAWLAGQYPDARFTIACGPYAAGLFHAVPRLERLIVLAKQPWKRHWYELWRSCAGTNWDLIMDLRNSLVSRLLIARGGKSTAASIPASIRYGDCRSNQGFRPPPAPQVWIDAAAEAEAAGG